MKRLVFPFIGIYCAICLHGQATIINIPYDYETIQEGIDASADGDTVLVQPGTYIENINFNGHNIVLGSLFLTTGDTTYISETIIDGDSSGTVATFNNNENMAACIMGFTLQNGLNHYGGGGILCIDSSPIIRHNAISDNSAGIYDRSYGFGGGICCISSEATIEYNSVCHNWAVGYYGGAIGGGIYCSSSNTTIRNNIINQNHAMHAAGIFSSNSSSMITGNTITANIAQGLDAYTYGGGILCDNNSDIICSNNIIICNGVFGGYGAYGGGICCRNSNLSMKNNTISMNVANIIWDSLGYGGGIYCEGTSMLTITNTILWGDTATENANEIFVDDASWPEITYSCIRDTLWPGEGNMDLNPLFRDPENRDFHLMSIACGDPYDSPCIDVGHPDIIDSLLDCSWGLGTILSDMGAYGGGDSATVGINDQQQWVPDRFFLLQNYPNPFNAATVLNYALSQAGQISISIYNLLGQQVVTLYDGMQQAGEHKLIWDAADIPSGVYFARLQTDDYSKSIKMVFLK